MLVKINDVAPCVLVLRNDDGLDSSIGQLLDNADSEIFPVIFVTGKNRIVQHDKSSSFLGCTGKKQRQSKAVKLRLAEHGNDVADLWITAVRTQRQPGLEIYRSPRIGALHDTGKEAGIMGAKQGPPCLHTIGKLLEFLVE